MISYYLNRGHDINKLLNLGYYEKMFYIAAMQQTHEEDIEEKVALNPFLKRK